MPSRDYFESPQQMSKVATVIPILQMGKSEFSEPTEVTEAGEPDSRVQDFPMFVQTPNHKDSVCCISVHHFYIGDDFPCL